MDHYISYSHRWLWLSQLATKKKKKDRKKRTGHGDVRVCVCVCSVCKECWGNKTLGSNQNKRHQKQIPHFISCMQLSTSLFNKKI